MQLSSSRTFKAEVGVHSFAMGCGSSSRVDAVQPSVQKQKNGRGAKTQTSNNLSQRAAGLTLLDEASWSKGSLDSGVKLEEELDGANSPGEDPEKSLSSGEKNNGQNTDIMLLSGGFINNPMHLRGWERQKSSDILDELMMQGIIKCQSTTSRNREADVKRDILEKHLRKPPAKLEKLTTEKKEVNTLTREQQTENSDEERRNVI